MGESAVNVRITAPASLVRNIAGISHTRQDQPVPDALNSRFVARQPRDRPDGAGSKQKAIRVTMSRILQTPSQSYGKRDARQVVVGQRGMTNMRRDEHFLRFLTFQQEF